MTGPLDASRGGIRAVYRDGTGELHLDWPVDRVPEAIRDPKGTLWVDIQDPPGKSSPEAERLLGDVFKFHPLAVEDAVRDSHVPRLDDWGDHLYIAFHASFVNAATGDLQIQELDAFLGSNYLVTYHQGTLPFIVASHDAIHDDPRGRMRNGADHLLFRLLDRAVDQSLDAIESLDDRVDRLQDKVMAGQGRSGLADIFELKRSASRLQRTFAPQRDVLGRLSRDPYRVVRADHRVYFRDVYDHVVRIHDITEGLRDLIAGTLDTYLTVTSNRTNDIMKALTMVTVMFMPMSFLTGFFGMNFFGEALALEGQLPKWGLFLGALAFMALSPVAMLVMARRRGWI
ncbi:magnesium/cobalt transporter CorA [Paludisphaera sp.]|uniref:magnesium/cobalt transporter CorA n=1 Tax=Paludisphaera sp. TaxID=2017432 RepID=UPI00301C0BA9